MKKIVYNSITYEIKVGKYERKESCQRKNN